MASKPIIVLKVGTSTLTKGKSTISVRKLNDISRQIAELKKEYDVVLVSSGAIAAAKSTKSLIENPELIKSILSKPALSAIGQPKLMHEYIKAFNKLDMKAAQCLLTHNDFNGEVSRTNTKNTILALLKSDYVPIINENDTVAVEEIELGDNDKLSALVSKLIDANKLIIASDIDGIYDKNPQIHKDAKLIGEITDINEVKKYIDDIASSLGTGGMQSKVHALEICKGHGIEVIIVNGGISFFLQKVLNNEIPHTTFKS